MSSIIAALARAFALALVFLGCTLARANAQTSTGDPPTPDAVVAAYEAALDTHDAKRALEFLSDSVIVVGAVTATGKPQVEAWIQDQIDHGVIIETGPLRVNGSRVTWLTRIWRSDWSQDGVSLPRFVDHEAAVSGNLITVVGVHVREDATGLPQDVQYVRASQVTPAAAAAAQGSGARAQLALLGAGALVAPGVLLGLATRRGSPGKPSSLRGRLVRALCASGTRMRV